MRIIGRKQEFIAQKELIRITEIIIRKFISRGVIPHTEFDDVKQSVLANYYQKQTQIENGYNGSAKAETYCSAVLYRMTCEIIRKELSYWKNSRKEQEYDTASKAVINRELSPEENLLIKNEVGLLKKVLLTLGSEKTKTEFFLRAFYQLNFSGIEDCPTTYLPFAEQLQLTFDKYQNISEKDIFKVLSDLIFESEGKKVAYDAVRMYVNKQVLHITERLNYCKGGSTYNKKTLGILFEYYVYYTENKENTIPAKNLALSTFAFCACLAVFCN